MQDKPILVAGGGIGGLAAALGLAKKGFAVTVLERAAVLGEVGAGIQLGPNAFHAFDQLGVGDAARGMAVYVDTLRLMDAMTAEDICSIDLGEPFRRRFGNPYAVVHRAAQPAATVTRTVTMATMSEVADELLPLIDRLAARGQAPSGPAFLRYLVIDMAGELVVQAGVPVSVPVEGDGHVEPDELPAGDYLRTVHVGPYDGLEAATGALLAHAEREGLRFDVQRQCLR